MLSLEDLRIDRFQSNPNMPWGMRVMHTPSGLSVEGNCKQESGYDRLQEVLVAALNQSVMKDWKAPEKATRVDLAYDREILLEQMAQMQAQIDRLISGGDPTAKPFASPEPKRRGRPPKAGKAAKKAKAARAELKTEPAPPLPDPNSKEALEFIRGQMRAPTDSPVDRYAPGTHQSRGGVAVKVSDEALKKGIRP